MGPREGGSPGARGRAEPQELGRRLGRRPGVSARGRRSNQALPTCLSIGMSVCAPGAAEPCRAPGKARLAHLQPPPAPGKQDRGAVPGSSSWASSLRREPRLFSGAARGSRARSPRHCRGFLLSLLLQIPSPDAPLARWLPGRLWARAGGRAAREAVPRRAEGGVSSVDMGKARRGSGLGWGPTLHPTLQAAPGAGHPGSAPCLLPPGSARSFCKPRWGSDSRRLRTTGSLGGLVEGYRREESIFRGKRGTAGVLYAEFGVMIGRRHPSMTMTKKKW